MGQGERDRWPDLWRTGSAVEVVRRREGLARNRVAGLSGEAGVAGMAGWDRGGWEVGPGVGRLAREAWRGPTGHRRGNR